MHDVGRIEVGQFPQEGLETGFLVCPVDLYQASDRGKAISIAITHLNSYSQKN